VTDRGNVKWRTVVADFNPNAGHKEVHMWRTLSDFAEASQKSDNGKSEFLGVVDDDGYVVNVAQGINGHCYYTDDMRKDMVGKHVTHYHNRPEATQQQIDETNESINEWRTVKRAYNRYQTANDRINGYTDDNGTHIKGANERLKDANRQIRIMGGNPNADTAPANASARLRQAYDEKQAAWHEYQLAMRQKQRAEADFKSRYKAYTGDDARNISIPPLKNVTIDETGWIGGPFSAGDIDSTLLSSDIKSFSASCDEGTYTIAMQGSCTDNDLLSAKAKVRALFVPEPTKGKDGRIRGKDMRTQDAIDFQKRLKSIDRKTAEEGRKNGWSKQQIVATSMNRQMAYLWQKEKEIFAKYHISASFTANPNYKPKWDF